MGADDVAVDDQLTQDSEIDCDDEPPIEVNHDTPESTTPEPAPSVDITSPEAAAALKQMKIEAALLIDQWRSNGKQTVDDQHVNSMLHNLLPALLARLPALPGSAREARSVVRSALGGDDPFTTKTIEVCNNCHYRQLDRGSDEECPHCSTSRK